MYRCKLETSYFPAQDGAAPPAETISDLVRRKARALGPAPALRELSEDGDFLRSWSYRELCDDAERLSRALANRHEQGERIAVYANNIPEWLLLEYAAAMAGLVLVTVNPAFQERELRYVLEQSGASALYFVESFRGNPMGEIAARVCADLPAVRTRIDLCDHGALFAGEDREFDRAIAPSDPVQIQYTSGTTGFPKGAVLHHHGLVQNGVDAMTRGGVGEGDVFVHYMPLFHTTGCAIMALGGLAQGATMLLAPLFDPKMAAAVMEREQVRFALGVPTMLVALMNEAEAAGRDLSCVERVMSGGSMVAPELVRRAARIFGAPVQIIYGQTEASPVITAAWAEDAVEDLTGTIGQPLPHVEAAIRDPQTDDIVGLGEQGEICCRGYLVMTGYFNNEEATRAAIDEEGWLRTGDLGRMDARGYLTITGRVKEMIIRGGENLFPAEIENAILEHPAIAEVAVVGAPDEAWGEEVACFLRARSEDRPTPDELKRFLRERLSPQKTPVYWCWVEEWPLTGSGKIQKFRLREMIERGEAALLTTAAHPARAPA